MEPFRRIEVTVSTSVTQDDDLMDASVDEGGADPRWYVDHDGDHSRFLGPDGLPALHLITYTDTHGETVLRLCEDTTGLLIGPTDRRLPTAGIYVSQLRGEAYHQIACRAGDFTPGHPVMLMREPTNAYDKNAIAVFDATATHLAAYVNKQKARMLARLLDAGHPLRAISIRGTPASIDCEQVAILAATPSVVDLLMRTRPSSLPTPAHLLDGTGYDRD